MAFDEHVADRIRQIVGDRPNVTERAMFGGLAFLVGGNMAIGLVGDDLLVRLGETGARSALAEPHTREMDFTGRPMKSMIFVSAAGYASATALQAWVDRGLGFASSLPAKEAAGRA